MQMFINLLRGREFVGHHASLIMGYPHNLGIFSLKYIHKLSLSVGIWLNIGKGC
jgi:hypothetical protein